MAHHVETGQPSNRSRWHWLLLIPVVLPLITVLYNRREPYFLGFPRFYWLQLAFIIVAVATTMLVYQLTKTRSVAGEGPVAGDVDRGDAS